MEKDLKIRKILNDINKVDVERTKNILIAYQRWLNNNKDEVKDMSTMEKIHSYLGL
jgi:hypothetical protein